MKRTLSNVSSKYGATMGRRDNIPSDIHTVGKLHLVRMRMVDGAYDTGGAYWGCGHPLTGYMYWAYGETETEQVDIFIRAQQRHHAKELIKKQIPQAKFYR